MPIDLSRYHKDNEDSLDLSGYHENSLDTSLEPIEQEVPDRSWLEVGGDLATSFASGANTLLKIGGDLYGLTTGDMENWASEQGKRGADYWNARKSDTLKTMESNRSAKIAAADGTLAKAGIAFWDTLSSPTLLTSFMFEQVPMLLPIAGVGRAAGAGAKLLGAGTKVAETTATGAAVTTGAGMQGADAGRQAYDQLKAIPDKVWETNSAFQQKITDGVPYDQAKDELALELSQDAAIASAVISGVVNLIPGARMLEKQLAGVKLPGINKMKTAATGFFGEGISEGLEEGGGALMANIATSQIDESQELMEGVGEATGLGAVSAVFGGAAGLQSKGAREIIQDIEDTSAAIQSAPTVDSAIETGNAIVGAQIAETIEGAENVEAQKIIDAQREAAEAVLAQKPEAQPEVPVSPVQEMGDTFGAKPEDALPLTDEERVRKELETQAEAVLDQKPEAPKPLTDEERIQKEVDIQAKAKARITEQERIKEKDKPREAVISELTLSPDIPQFKKGANEKGLVEPLGGTFERSGVGPIQVWVRKDGKQEVITGRHRFDLAKRSGMATIPAQFHYENDGFDVKKARNLDAILNIREGQGQVRDYVTFIKDAGMTEEQAEAEGILARATGKNAFTIAKDGSDLLIAAHGEGIISDMAATKISQAAPNNEGLQTIGLKALEEGKTIAVAVNIIKAVETLAPTSGPETGDMFGFDTEGLRQAEDLAKAATRKQAEIQRVISAVKGASKRPELAAKEGVNVNDPSALKQRIVELTAEKAKWKDWHTNPELIAELQADIQPVKEPVEEPVKEPVQEPSMDFGTEVSKERFVDNEDIPLRTLKSFGNAKDAAIWVSESASEPVFRLIAKQIIQALPESISFDILGSGKRKRSIIKGRYREYTHPITGEILKQEVGLHREGRTTETLTHELIHAAAVEMVEKPRTPQQRVAVDNLKDVADGINMAMMVESKAMATLTKDEQNAVLVVGSNYHEFVTHTLTNPIYQSALKKIPYKDSRISTFQKVSNTIKKLLGIEGVTDTAFSKAIEVSAAIVEATGQNVAAKKKQPVNSRVQAYRATLKEGLEPSEQGYTDFISGMKTKFSEVIKKGPKDTITGHEDLTQFIRAQNGEKIPLSEITLTRKLTSKNGKISVAQVKADVVLRQTKKKRDTALKLLRCVQ